MRSLGILAALAAAAWAVSCGDAFGEQQYIVHLKVVAPPGANGRPSVLCEPMFVAVEGRPISFTAGGSETVALDEDGVSPSIETAACVDFGLMTWMHVKRLSDKKVALRGVVTNSEIVDARRDVVTKKALSVHFVKAFPLGEAVRLPVPESLESVDYMEFLIEEASPEAFEAAALPVRDADQHAYAERVAARPSRKAVSTKN